MVIQAGKLVVWSSVEDGSVAQATGSESNFLGIATDNTIGEGFAGSIRSRSYMGIPNLTGNGNVLRTYKIESEEVYQTICTAGELIPVVANGVGGLGKPAYLGADGVVASTGTVIVGEFMSSVLNGVANIRLIPSIVAGTVVANTQSADTQSGKNKSNKTQEVL
jgi:hypothetical protein